MMCGKPPKAPGGNAFPCGKCLPCRINKSRQWQARLMLEWAVTGIGSFITLTYAPEFLPAGGHLDKAAAQRFMKRLRLVVKEELGIDGLRFHLVGEYGTRSWRPHFHVTIFGVVLPEELVKKAWKYGFIHVGLISADSLAYVVGYCLKKLTRPSASLEGRPPEFMLSSRRPGLGATALPVVAKGLKVEKVIEEIRLIGVPREVRFEGRLWPLDRYSRCKLEEHLADEVDFKDKCENHLRALTLGLSKPLLSSEEVEKRRRESTHRALSKLKRKRNREKI